MRVDAYATLPHYREHIEPVWRALPAEVRGRFYVAGALADFGDRGDTPGWVIGHPPAAAGLPVIVAGYVDEMTLPARRPVIYLEHGAGQAYRGDYTAADDPSYHGGYGHDNAVLFLCPREEVAARWRERYPKAKAFPIGCPKLDELHRDPPPGEERTVAITFHSEARLCPETLSALPHYELGLRDAVTDLQRAGWTVLGHGHPRVWRKTSKLWDELGVEKVRSFDEVLRRARVLAVDNSSAGPEFASLGKPIVWLNAPWFRRETNHGGRFWDWTEGIPTVDGPEQLADAVIAADSSPDVAEACFNLARRVYFACDGRAAERAAMVIERL